MSGISTQKLKGMAVKFYTEEKALDMVLGCKGTPERDIYEMWMNSFLMGEATKKARLSKNVM
ncbi:MAG: hypothetical protein Q4C43_08835 [Prevotella sp.]|nr:hypothetical protein [Prevotella sp.]